MNVSLRHMDSPTLHEVTVGNLDLYFSYQTVVAFRGDDGLVVSENVWSVTTGKHLSMIDGGRKAYRVPHDVFSAQLATALGEIR